MPFYMNAEDYITSVFSKFIDKDWMVRVWCLALSHPSNMNSKKLITQVGEEGWYKNIKYKPTAFTHILIHTEHRNRTIKGDYKYI